MGKFVCQKPLVVDFFLKFAKCYFGFYMKIGSATSDFITFLQCINVLQIYKGD